MQEDGQANVWVMDANHPIARQYVDIECGAVFPQFLVIVNGGVFSRRTGIRPASEVRSLLSQGVSAYRMAQNP